MLKTMCKMFMDFRGGTSIKLMKILDLRALKTKFLRILIRKLN